MCVLSEKPRLIAIHDGMTWSVLGSFGIKSGLVCCLSTCKDRKNKCSHLEAYVKTCENQDIEPDIFKSNTEEPILNIRSFKPISYHPMAEALRTKSHRLAAGLDHFPDVIQPDEEDLNGHCMCPEKHPWASLVHTGRARIFSPSTVVDTTVVENKEHPIEVYVGTTDKCTCRLSADGQSLTLLNINDRDFLTYGLLTQFLAIICHGTPAYSMYANMLYHTYTWSAVGAQVSKKGLETIIRAGIRGFSVVHSTFKHSLPRLFYLCYKRIQPPFAEICWRR